MTQKLQQLQEAIREVCTELKDEVAYFAIMNKIQYDEVSVKKGFVTYKDYGYENGFKSVTPIVVTVRQSIIHNFSAPTLQHVLRALSFKCCAIKINQIGGISLYSESGSCWQDLAYPRFNLEKPLDQQSPEVIDFLHSIICEA